METWHSDMDSRFDELKKKLMHQDIRILLYFFMPVHLIASIARTGISEMRH
jgi:hypothetical protein